MELEPELASLLGEARTDAVAFVAAVDKSAKQRAYWAAHPEKRKAADARYYERHKAERATYDAAYYRANKRRIIARQVANNRARRQADAVA